MLIYNLQGKYYDDIVIKPMRSTITEASVQTNQFYRKELLMVKQEVVTWYYKPEGTGCIITKCVTDSKEVIIIPLELNGLVVRGIDSYAFKGTKAHKIIAPHKVRLTLKDYAFAELASTREIQLLAGASIPGIDVFKNSPCEIKFRR